MKASLKRPVLAVVSLTAMISGFVVSGPARAQPVETASPPFTSGAGDLDPGFGTGGKVTTALHGAFDRANALAVQADGKLVAAGMGFGVDFALARYNPDGSLDSSFGTGGTVTTDFFGSNDEANALVVQADGKLVTAGETMTEASDIDVALARYNPDGSLDSSFGTGGKVTTDFAGGFDQANALVMQADGKLVAAGKTGISPSQVILARYNPDGSLDSSFGTGGQVTTEVSGIDQAFALAVQADGKLVAAGIAGNPTDFALFRYNPNGSLDSTFGTGGTVITDFGGSSDQANALVVRRDGKLVAAGQTHSATGAFDFALARYNPNGSVDSTFGRGGMVITDIGSSTDQANALAVQADGRLVAAGQTRTATGAFDFALARYNLNGSLDPSFGRRGTVTTDIAFATDGAFALVVQADGKLVAAGFAEAGEGADFALARYFAR